MGATYGSCFAHLRKRAKAPSLHHKTLMSWEGKRADKRKGNYMQKWDQPFGLYHIHKPQGKAAPAQRRSWLHILCQVTFCSPKLLALEDIHIFTTFLKVISAVSPAEPLNIN